MRCIMEAIRLTRAKTYNTDTCDKKKNQSTVLLKIIKSHRHRIKELQNYKSITQQ